jgi:pyruvate dehydrogenase E2 component (dihydrolipoamide acetyltransferase)
MSASKREIPHFYLASDVEITELLNSRRQLNELQGRPRVTFTHLFVAAVARALLAAPAMNRVWSENGCLAFATIDVGIAVDTKRGLMNPVVHDIGQDDFYVLVRKIEDVIARARRGALRADDVRGGAITVSNAGMRDIRYMTSIIVPGQSMILGIGSVQECFRPDSSGGPSLCREIGLVLSADHRLHTGVSAASFLDQLKNGLSRPLTLLMGRS